MRDSSRPNYKITERKHRRLVSYYPRRFRRAGAILGILGLAILLIWTLSRIANADENMQKNNPTFGSSEELSAQTISIFETLSSQDTPLSSEGFSVSDAELEKSDIKGEAWQLVLVNDQNPVPSSHNIFLEQVGDGQAVDERCSQELQQMLQDCRTAGLSPYLCSSYRTQEKQEQLFEEQKNYYLLQGYSDAEAEEKAGTSVALPGTSEHQLGLAVDIVDQSDQNLDSSQENTEVQQWLMQNSWKYGFVLRYPSDKCDITGIIFEPWHYRYVGKAAAQDMYSQKVCLEEYLGKYRETGG